MNAAPQIVKHSDHITQHIYVDYSSVFLVTNPHRSFSNLWTNEYRLPTPPIGLVEKRTVFTTCHVDADRNIIRFQDSYRVQLIIDAISGTSVVRLGNMVFKTYATLNDLANDMRAAVNDPWGGCHLPTQFYTEALMNGSNETASVRHRAILQRAFPSGTVADRTALRGSLESMLTGMDPSSVLKMGQEVRDKAIVAGLRFAEEFEVLLKLLARVSAKLGDFSLAFQYLGEREEILREMSGEQSQAYTRVLAEHLELHLKTGDQTSAKLLAQRISDLDRIVERLRMENEALQKRVEARESIAGS